LKKESIERTFLEEPPLKAEAGTVSGEEVNGDKNAGPDYRFRR